MKSQVLPNNYIQHTLIALGLLLTWQETWILLSAQPLTHKHSPLSPLPHSQDLSSDLTSSLCSAQPASSRRLSVCLTSSASSLSSVLFTVCAVAVALLILDLLTVLGTKTWGLAPAGQAFYYSATYTQALGFLRQGLTSPG